MSVDSRSHAERHSGHVRWGLIGVGALLCTLVAPASGLNGGESAPGAAPVPSVERLAVMVNGVQRTALVYPGRAARVAPSPLLLAFHGFSGSAQGMANETRFQTLWPEATVVYPQGLAVLKPSIKYWAPGWPDMPGQYENRDIRYVDALLKALRAKYRVDDRRIYATGFSNGATFTYLLYTQRPGPFAAFAGCAGPARFLGGAQTPRPLFSINGENDGFVPYDLAISMLEQFVRANRCGWDYSRLPSQTPTAEDATAAKQPVLTIQYIQYPSQADGAPVVWGRHAGTHLLPVDAPAQIVAFLKGCSLPGADSRPSFFTTVL